MGTIASLVPGPFEATDIPALARDLKGLTRVADVDDGVLARLINRAISEAVARRDIEQVRPANHEILDFLHGIEAEATALLGLFGLLDQFNPFPATPLVPDHNADWFVHLRKGLAMSEALPWWFSSGNIGPYNSGTTQLAVSSTRGAHHAYTAANHRRKRRNSVLAHGRRRRN